MRAAVLLSLLATSAFSATPVEVKAALVKAVEFYQSKAAIHGGYVYHYSADFTLREAEGIPGPDTIWIQPPGTPGVGDAMMDAYEATQDPRCLAAAKAAADAVAACQHPSGGWDYSGVPAASPPILLSGEAGWHAWKSRKSKGTLDDDVTQSAIRLLLRTQHPLAESAVRTLIALQYPNGAWSASFDSVPSAPADVQRYPVKQASYPEDWPRKWPKDFTGCYVLNDNLHARAIDALLLAWKLQGNEAAKAAALKAGDFLLLAQMPAPQPAWAQQYDAAMQPCWSRAFEPTAICGRESQAVMWALIRLAQVTGEMKYLAPIPSACAYLNASLLPNGKIARFYELQTNKPLYFERGKGGKGFILTYDGSNASSNYGWEWPSETAALLDAHDALKSGQQPKYPKAEKERWSLPPTAAEVDAILKEQNAEGAWIEKDGTMRDAEAKKVQPQGGVIHSLDFVQNVKALSSWLRQKTP
jgi:PelA/Pel-15E family pectate lyase